MMTDPISDMLTRIRNGGGARLPQVDVPDSRIKREIARLLQERGYLEGYESGGEEKRPMLRLALRYNAYSLPMIEGLERVSKPGRRVYVGVDRIPKVRNGLGMAILSTPKGILSDEQARESAVGGEVLLRVW